MKTRLLLFFLFVFSFGNAQNPSFFNVNAQNVTSTTTTINFQVQNNCLTYAYRAELATDNSFSTSFTTSTEIANNYCNTSSPISHSADFTGLLPNTTYYYRARVNVPPNLYYSTVGSFTTAGLAPVFGTPNAIPSFNSALINYALVAGVGQSNMTVYWGTNAASLINSITATPILNSGPSSATISGLNPQTVYYYNITAVSSNGFATSTTGSFTTSAIPTAVAEYNFNSTYNNVNGNTPFAYGSGTSFVSDRNNVPSGALSIAANVTNPNVTIPSIPQGASERSISIWYKIDSNANFPSIFSYGTAANGQTFGLYLGANGNPIFQGFGAGNDFDFGGAYVANTWHHVVITLQSNGSLKLYLNGNLLNTITRTLNTVGTNFLLRSNFVTTQVDDLKIYNVALSQADVTSLYTNNTLSSQNFSQNNLEVALYPNPVRDILNIDAALELQSVEIYNIQGQKVLSSNKKQINVSDLAAGMYMIRIQDAENEIATKKFIKK